MTPLRLIALLLACLLPVLTGCPEERADDDDTAADDDDAGTDDDDATGDDDDATNEDTPVFLASFDFNLIMLENEPHGIYDRIEGQMDVSVSTTQFLAELETSTGETWEWSGTLENNEGAFHVRGWMVAPGGTEETFVEVAGNFQPNSDGTVSQVCLVGTGVDDDPNYPDQGIRFIWYGCQPNAPAPAIDRAGSYTVALTVQGDDCNAWVGQTAWTESWSFVGRRLVVTRPNPAGGTFTAYGVLSDDGNVFHYTWLEQINPGRVLKVPGDFTSPTNTTESRANGFCHEDPSPTTVGAVIDIDFP
jgi:hypothetical protein